MSALGILLLLCALRYWPGRRRRQLWRSVGKPPWWVPTKGTAYDGIGNCEGRSR